MTDALHQALLDVVAAAEALVDSRPLGPLPLESAVLAASVARYRRIRDKAPSDPPLADGPEPTIIRVWEWWNENDEEAPTEPK